MIAASKLPATIASRYVPVRLIGKGGMGVVYEVEHARTGEHLALKVLLSSAGATPEALERFKREARAPAQIKSENVVRVSDADVAPELDGAPFLVMELLEGMDLEEAASLSKPDPATVVGWLRQIAPALDKAHRLGIIHRDLKPENLFLATVEARPPVVKILDFGIAKMAEGTAATVSGEVLGTPKYMAPEQADRHPRITPATDRYALGLIAYRLLVGESYYQGDVMSILADVLYGAPSAPSARNPSLGEPFDAWFMKACHREPESRFASVSEQIEALGEALGVPSGTDHAPRERLSSSPRSLEVDVALPATTLSHKSLFRSPITRRTLVAGALVLAAGAAALWYRGSNEHKIDVSPAPATPAPAAAVPGFPSVDIGAAVGPLLTREPPAAPGTVPSAVLERTVGASAGSPEVRTAAPVAAAASSNPVADKPRPRPSRVSTVGEPPKAPAVDPFKDQK
jgi:serine/threonine-protein kinase